jgi:hypothetical protein
VRRERARKGADYADREQCCRSDVTTRNRPDPNGPGNSARGTMDSIIYLVGLIVIVMFILSALGLR